MVYVYENHMGGVYFSEEYDESYLETCEQCFDSDDYLGIVESEQQLKSMLEGYYSEEYVKEACNEYREFTEDE